MHRFLEIDIITVKENSISDPQLWNLYTYCENDPINLIDPDGNLSIFSGIKNFSVGIYDTAKNTASGVFHMVTHPVQTAKGLFNVATHPIDTAKAIGNAVANQYENFMSADEETQSRMIGELTGQIMLISTLCKSGKAESSMNAGTKGGNVFNIAKAKYPKQFNQYSNLNTNQLQNAIKSHSNQILKHQNILKNPTTHVPKWNSFSPQHQANLIHHWQQDIIRHQYYKAIAEEILNVLK
jgi:hypothetical protein